ncbi:MAG: hypothetical protein EZS28_015554, partial [Streblomastix strix]
FDNLNPSSTNALMSITSSDNTQQAKITIIDCEFNQDSSSYSSLESTISNIHRSGTGNEAAISTDLQTGSQLLIKDSQFILCKGINSNGGAIYLYIANGGQATISNSSFDQCEAYDGGGVNLGINTGGKVSISNSSFSNCEANQGGGIRVDMQNYYSNLELTNLSFENCSAQDGGGLTIFAQDGPKFSINGKTTFKNCSSNTDGGGFNTKCNNTGEQINMTGQLEYEKCTSNRGGGMYVICRAYAIIVVNQLSFKDCSSSWQGGGLYVYCLSSQFNITGQSLFKNCESQLGGGCFLEVWSYEASFITNDLVLFDNCTSEKGGGIYSNFNNLGKMLSNNISFNDCKALFGGGIFLEIDNGTFKIDGATFDRCTCTQPGNGGALYLIQGLFSIISITNSSFINCKTILNSSNQSYGWGGAISIQTSITSENLEDSNFLLRDLIFIGCSTVNSIGNNIHIQSVNTFAIGEAIMNKNLVTVKDLSNPPYIISDLYTSVSYAYDYMGINESIQTSNPGTINLDLHNPLFEQSFTSNVPNPTYIDSINGKDIKFCGQLQTMCQTMKYAIDRNPTPLSGIPPSDTNYSIIMTSNTNLDTNIQIKSTTLNTRYIIIQSDEYSPETGNDIYIKRLISTSSFSNSLFTISETGDLSLLGLHFDNLNPSSTNPLISITSSDNTQQPKITIIDCEFNQDSSSYSSSSSSSSLSHSIISINGGNIIFRNNIIKNYNFTNGNSLIMIKSDKIQSSEYYRKNEIEIISSQFMSIEQSEGSGGSGIKGILNSLSKIIIKDLSKFERCICSQPGNGGAISLIQMNKDGKIEISNASFIDCQTISGTSSSTQLFGWGGDLVHLYKTLEIISIFDPQIHIQQEKQLKLIIFFNLVYRINNIEISHTAFSNLNRSGTGNGAAINALLQTGCQLLIKDSEFIQCNSYDSNGGAIYLNIDNGGQATISNSSFNKCEATRGGGMFIQLHTKNSILELASLNFNNCSAEYGGGLNVHVFEGHLSITGLTSFQNCECNYSGGGCYIEINNEGNVNFSSTDQIIFDNCKGKYGGGIAVLAENGGQLSISSSILLNNCQSIDIDKGYGGGMYLRCNGSESQILITGQIEFDNCSSTQFGGGMCLRIQNQQIIEISQMIFIDCSAEYGGGIYSIINNGGQINVKDQCLFTKCKSISNNGGGIYSDLNDGIFSIKDTTFDSCTCTQPGDGGALHFETGDLSLLGLHFDNLNPSSTNALMSITSSDNTQQAKITIIDCEFNQDSSSYSRSQILIDNSEFIQCKVSSQGGAIYLNINNQGQVTISNTSFNQCEAYYGGGIYAFINSGGQLTIDGQCNFTDCKAIFSEGSGGGICASIFDLNSQLTLEDEVKFEGCTSTWGGGGIIIDIQNLGTCIINKLQFNNCFAQHDGGGINIHGFYQINQIINGTQFNNCEAQIFGGGINAWIYPENSILELIGVTFENCSTFGSYCYGGGLFISLIGSSLLMPETCLFKNCFANYLGGGFYFQSTQEESQIQTNVDINQMEFKNCSADFGGGIFMNVNDGGQLSITGQTSFQNCESNQSGGGFYLQIQGGNVNFNSTDQLIFDNCKSKFGGGLIVIIEYDGQLSISSSILFNDCKCNIDNNGYGGGFYAECYRSESQIQITGQIEFENCSSTQSGGGMYIRINNQSTVEINEMQFKDCQSRYLGGGLLVSLQNEGNLTINGSSSFQNCKSNQSGGGIYSECIGSNNNIQITGQFQFEKCNSQSGGGIYSDLNDGTINIEDAIFDSCTCTQPGFGGGIALYQGYSSIISISNSSFINCKIKQNPLDQRYGWGGAIFIQTSVIGENLNQSNFLMRDLIFIGCSAVNSIGNNIHISSIETVGTGEAIKNGNLITVNETINLYYNNSYQQDYMGIDESETMELIIFSVVNPI